MATADFSPKIVLGVGAHPDDLEFYAGGSIARWIQEGAEVYYLILTNANRGTADRNQDQAELRELRRQEQRQAATILGIRETYFCNYQDGALHVTPDVQRDIVRIIRKVRPDTVVTFDPSVLYSAKHNSINHPDHRAAGQATLDAVYPLARDHLSFPELLHDEGLEPHNVATALLCNENTPAFFVDIAATIDTKLQALFAHASQMSDKPRIESLIRSQAAENGPRASSPYAEGFVRIDIA